MDLEDAIGAIAGHESGHVERMNSYESFQNEHKKGNYDVEKRSLEIEYKILEELKNNTTKKE